MNRRTDDLTADFERFIDQAAPEECRDLLGRLESAKAKLWVRLMRTSTPPSPVLESKLLTVDEVAEELRVKPSWVREKARRRELSGFKSGKEWKFSRNEVDCFRAKLEGLPLTGPPKRKARVVQIRERFGDAEED